MTKVLLCSAASIRPTLSPASSGGKRSHSSPIPRSRGFGATPTIAAPASATVRVRAAAVAKGVTLTSANNNPTLRRARRAPLVRRRRRPDRGEGVGSARGRGQSRHLPMATAEDSSDDAASPSSSSPSSSTSGSSSSQKSSNEAHWDADSQTTGLSAQLRTTNLLREKLSSQLFLVDPSLVAADVVYKSQVHEARGSQQYNELMSCWNPLIKRALLEFTYQTERAFSPEPGVLLIRWRAEWDGAFNANAATLTFIEENFPDYDVADLAELRRDVEGVDREWTGTREFSVRGITTMRVNSWGKIVSHEDRVLERGEVLDEVTGNRDDFLVKRGPMSDVGSWFNGVKKADGGDEGKTGVVAAGGSNRGEPAGGAAGDDEEVRRKKFDKIIVGEFFLPFFFKSFFFLRGTRAGAGGKGGGGRFNWEGSFPLYMTWLFSSFILPPKVTPRHNGTLCA